jgi:hypothetical protein
MLAMSLLKSSNGLDTLEYIDERIVILGNF